MPACNAMYPLQMQSLGYRAIQTQLMECASCTPHPFATPNLIEKCSRPESGIDAVGLCRARSARATAILV
jgi:hypothetical protein